MENLGGTLDILMALKHGLVCGQSPRRILQDLILKNESGEVVQLAYFVLERERISELQVPSVWRRTPLRLTLVRILECALQGQPVLPLVDRVLEVAWQQLELEQRIWLQRRPFLALLPLLLLQLPALGLELLLPFLDLFNRIS